ncbi:MAG: RHS domain-containing protein [Gallionella sp.]|nr:RHS domain-containing protein [Gallionella sp.]MDD4947496.1 RHS domain-containing protein [Gallionella sp.]
MKCREGRSILACPAAQKPLALGAARGQECASGEHPKLWRCAFFDSAQIHYASGQTAEAVGPASLPSNRITANATEGQTYYIHADHLDTPRQITDTQGNVVWRWDNQDPFGNNIPNENPNGAGQFSFHLRFPGQYADKETNTYYNINRDYDSALGRYVESDPIGLAGGINTYAYVRSNPLSRTDPLGLWSFTFGGYAGVGGEVTFGNDGGNGFMTFRAGFGVGAGISYDPNGGMPGSEPKDRCSGGVVLSDSAQASFTAGPLNANAEAGAARNYSNNESVWYVAPSYSASPSFKGLGATGSFGGQVTIYSGNRQ